MSDSLKQIWDFFRAKPLRERDPNHNKFEAVAVNLNGENDKVYECKNLRFEIDLFGSFDFSFALLSYWERERF